MKYPPFFLARAFPSLLHFLLLSPFPCGTFYAMRNLAYPSGLSEKEGEEAAGTGEEGKVGTRKGGREYPQQRGGGPGPGDQ